jgi:hypothetical protein
LQVSKQLSPQVWPQLRSPQVELQLALSPQVIPQPAKGPNNADTKLSALIPNTRALASRDFSFEAILSGSKRSA